MSLRHHLDISPEQGKAVITRSLASQGNFVRIGLVGVGRIGAFTDVATDRTASPCTLEDAFGAFYIAGACELSRPRDQPVLMAEVRR
jgi:hypothetical protein